MLAASEDLRSCLEAVGTRQHFDADQFLFQEESTNTGVFLIVRGKVRMSVKGLPKLDRLFPAAAILGLPSTFTGHPYSLTAQTLTDSDIVHVTQEAFVQLMRERPDLCSEATQMLGREVTFIQGALTERRKQAASRKVTSREVLA
jgi:CRP-like cAMP-binding protein